MAPDQRTDDPAAAAAFAGRTPGTPALARLTVDFRRLQPGRRVLDLGCGDGHHAQEALHRGCWVVAADIDAGAVGRTARSLPPVRAAVADALHLPFADAAFDAVVCTETLEHVADDRAAMREMARVLRPGGLLLASVPSHFTERLYWRLSPGYLEMPGSHVRIYTPRTLGARLRDAGFAVTSYRYVHFLDSLFWLRFALEDRLRRLRPRTVEEKLALLVEHLDPPQPAGWRLRLRRAVRRSTFITAIEAAGAWIYPKSLSIVARKTTA